jgi:hypothetical protein
VWKVVGDYSIVHSAVELGAEVLPVVAAEGITVYIHKMQQSRDVSYACYRSVVEDAYSYEHNP